MEAHEKLGHLAAYLNEGHSLLCHYTSFESACLILGSMKLRFSEPLHVNDINETVRTLFSGIESLDEHEKTYEEFRQISMTENGARKCFDIPAMWAHYAEKNKGTCLLFDKHVFLNSIDESIFHGSICYQSFTSGDVSLITDNHDEIRKRVQEIFFTKTTDWSYEQEYRIVAKFDNPETNTDYYLSIPPKSLLGAILCCNHRNESKDRFQNSKYETLKKIADIPILYYDKVFAEPRYSLYYLDEIGPHCICDYSKRNQVNT